MISVAFSIVLVGALAVISVSSLDGSSAVVIEALYPKDLGNLFLRGSDCGLSWDNGIVMKREQVSPAEYKYSLSVSCSIPTTPATKPLEVKVLIADKQWMLGSNHFIPLSSATNETTTQLFPWFFTYSGTLKTIAKVYSSELGNYRDIIYYLPPSYNENTLKRYSNVLVMHDGQNLFNPKTSAFGTAWMCQDTMDGLIIGGKSDEVLIAGAYNTNDRTNEYTYIYDPSEDAGGKGDLYLDWIESTLLPVTSQNFRVDIARETLGILGSSLGGLLSCYAGWTRSGVYGRVGCMSSSFWWDSNDFQRNVQTSVSPVVAGQVLVL